MRTNRKPPNKMLSLELWTAREHQTMKWLANKTARQMDACVTWQIRSIKTPVRSGNDCAVECGDWKIPIDAWLSHFCGVLCSIFRPNSMIRQNRRTIRLCCEMWTELRIGTFCDHKLNFEQKFPDDARPNLNRPHNECDISARHSLAMHMPGQCVCVWNEHSSTRRPYATTIEFHFANN